ncbi:hypothetical protein E4U50_007529 [Claviceps purpurea]|nr:hypothetical protein E4U50_007529 [Claviceps purpurea]
MALRLHRLCSLGTDASCSHIVPPLHATFFNLSFSASGPDTLVTLVTVTQDYLFLILNILSSFSKRQFLNSTVETLRHPPNRPTSYTTALFSSAMNSLRGIEVFNYSNLKLIILNGDTPIEVPPATRDEPGKVFLHARIGCSVITAGTLQYGNMIVASVDVRAGGHVTITPGNCPLQGLMRLSAMYGPMTRG